MLLTNEMLSLEDVKKEILEFCLNPQDREAILKHIHLETSPANYNKYIIQLLNQRFIKTNLLGNRRSPREKFIITQKGLNYLKAIA